MFLKRAGFRFKNFRIDFKNEFDASTDKYPDDIVESCFRLENWKPMYVPKARTDTVINIMNIPVIRVAIIKDYHSLNCNCGGHLTRTCTLD